MASAAAVGVNAALSPPRNDLGEDGGIPGVITSAVGSKDDGGLVEEGDIEGQENTTNGHTEGDGAAENGRMINGDDLFGDDEDDDLPDIEAPGRRQLDDEELDSGDDVDRTDRAVEEPATQEEEYDVQEKVMMDLEIARQPLPEPSDGEVRRKQ